MHKAASIHTRQQGWCQSMSPLVPWESRHLRRPPIPRIQHDPCWGLNTIPSGRAWCAYEHLRPPGREVPHIRTSQKEGAAPTSPSTGHLWCHHWPRLQVNAEKAMALHSSTLAWKIPWTEEPGGLQSMGLLKVRQDWVTSLSLFTFLFPALEKEMATHSSVLAWRIPGTGEPGGLPSMGLHRVRHDWSDLAAAAAAACKGNPTRPCSYSVAHAI